MAKNKTKFTVEELINLLRDEEENATIEGQLLRKTFIRELYKKLGNPKEEDFPNEFKIAGRYWKKFGGYTLGIDVISANKMMMENRERTYWRINKASMTKVNIVEDYTRDGWHCEVQSYNVICRKFAKHPRYKNLWVYFYSSRDCNKYEYVIERKEK